jgi:ABC-2 type transport system ATP-binding protein
VIVIHDLSKQFSSQGKPALKNIEAVVPKGEIVGLVGPDGAGKTTLLRLIAALLLPTKGTITVADYDTVKDAEVIHYLTGYMPQKFGLYEDLTVMQNLNLYADLRGVLQKDKKGTFDRLLQFTGLAPFTKRLARDLSGGMKQKLGLACALVKKPTLLLLDEPSVGVDPISRRELWKMVYGLLDEGISVIWSTAYLDEAEKCHTVLLLSEGELMFYGKPQELIQKTPGCTRFEEAFFHMLDGKPLEKSELARIMPSVTGEKKGVVVADGLTKKFGTFTAAENMTFSVDRGEIFGLLGPNGAGKSTTFKMLCGLLKPTAGKVRVNHVDLQVAPGKARSHIGYMAQKFSLYGNLSVKQNLDFFAGIYNLSGKRKTEAVDEMIRLFHLEPYLSASAEELPLGFKQRLALACSTMHHPEILFLDEPTAGVDPLTRREFWNHINGLVEKGVTIMVTTHFMDEAEFCGRIALIYRGKMIKMGTPIELKESAASPDLPHPTLEDAFVKLIQGYDANS